MDPKVSVVIPTYRRPSLLMGVVQDVLSQPFRDIEVLVVDDGSGDETEARAREITDARFRYLNEGKLGMPGVLNVAIERTTAPYVMFLHDHDRIEPSLISELAGALDRNPSAGFAFCGYVFYDSELAQEQERWLLDLPELTPGREFLSRVLMPRINSPVLALSMVRRSALQGEGFDPEIGGCADVELWHRLAARSDVAYVRKPLIHIRGRDTTSVFANSRSTLDLMANTMKAKQRFLPLMEAGDQPRLQSAWRKQVTAGGGYVAWKAFESGDRATLDEARRYVGQHGTSLGSAALSVLSAFPAPVGRGVLRGVRQVVRRLRGNTL